MSFQVISDYLSAVPLIYSQDRLYRFFKTWIPEDKFIELLYSDGGISVFRDDSTPVAFCFGINPPIRADWKMINLEVGVNLVGESHAIERVEWETYFIEPRRCKTVIEDYTNKSDLEIETFLRRHAPDSSVYPGNGEIVKWVCVEEAEQLMGVAALCKWESGELVVASVAIHQDFRNQGIGVRLMNQVCLAAKKLEVDQICLGVLSSNHSAKALYGKAGWQPLFKFTYLEFA